jgi:trehalose 6-phosphate phosphatase
VISGRPAAFLQAHLGGRGLFLSGLYGLELVTEDGAVEAIPDADQWRPVVEEVAAAAEGNLPRAVTVERKGLSVTVHYRADPTRKPDAERWVGQQAEVTGLVVHPARMSYELRPPVERDKGAVLAEAAEARRQVCFLGDDRGDLSAFDALDRLAAGGATVLRVGVDSGEAPEELLARADLVVDGPEGSLSVLRALLGPNRPSSAQRQGREGR